MSEKHNLLHPIQFRSCAEVLGSKTCLVPKKPGVYAWYFKEIPPGVPTDLCHKIAGYTLLYIGISPKATPTNGRAPSSQRLFHRVRYHMSGNAEGSTLRLSLGCLLSQKLSIQLRCVGNGKRMTFADGERTLSEWMEKNAFVVWTTCDKPWELEEELIKSLSLPLNLQMNKSHPFHAKLSEARKTARILARQLPVSGGKALRPHQRLSDPC